MKDHGSGEFTPQNEFESLLLRAALDPAERPNLYRAIQTETLLVLGRSLPNPNPDSSGNVNTPVELYGIDIEDRKVIPAFTCEYRIQEFIATAQPYIALAGGDLLAMLEPDVGLVLNPASACGKEFLPAELERLRSAPKE